MPASTPKALQDTYDLILWMIPSLSKFPRDQRFLLGDRIQTTLLDVLESLAEASYSRAKAVPLERANLAAQKPRLLLRLTLDLMYMNLDSDRFAIGKLDEAMGERDFPVPAFVPPREEADEHRGETASNPVRP